LISKYGAGIYLNIERGSENVNFGEIWCPECRHLEEMRLIQIMNDANHERIVQPGRIIFATEEEETVYEFHMSSYHKMIK
jgi:hypothetical protein